MLRSYAEGGLGPKQRKAIELTRLPMVAQDAKHCMAWGAIELTHLTRVAQDAKHCMAWRAIEGNRTHPFDSGSAGCPNTAWPWVKSKAIELTRLTRVVQDAKRCMASGSGSLMKRYRMYSWNRDFETPGFPVKTQFPHSITESKGVL